MPFWLLFILLIVSFLLGIMAGMGAIEKDQEIICSECIAKGED